jgi:hypothetical protein
VSARDAGVYRYRGGREYRGFKWPDGKAAGPLTIAEDAHAEPGLIENGRTDVIIPPDEEGALCSPVAWMAAPRAETRAMGRRAWQAGHA